MENLGRAPSRKERIAELTRQRQDLTRALDRFEADTRTKRMNPEGWQRSVDGTRKQLEEVNAQLTKMQNQKIKLPGNPNRLKPFAAPPQDKVYRDQTTDQLMVRRTDGPVTP